MKILQVIPAFPPSEGYGGAPVVAYEISKKLVQRGHEVTVYTTDANNKKSRLSTKNKHMDGFEVYYFKNISNSLAWHRLFFTPSMLPQLSKEIKNFDVIHLHCFRSFLNIATHHYAKKYGIPYILQAHGGIPYINQKTMLKKNFDGLLGHRILEGASKLIAVSKAEAEQYKQMGVNEDKIVTVPNGVDIEAFKNLPAYGKFREKYNVKEKHMILFLGQICKRKGIDFLIKAFSELTKEMSEVALIIIGSDSGYKVEVEKLIMALNLSNRIKLIGYIDEKDKLSAYVDADVLVYPGIFEIFGLVPFEAMMCGTPVIVTDDCGCGELVKESGAGYLIKYGDINDLKEKMKLVIENPEEGREMVERGKKYIERNFMWDKVVNMVDNVYKNSKIDHER